MPGDGIEVPAFMPMGRGKGQTLGDRFSTYVTPPHAPYCWVECLLLVKSEGSLRNKKHTLWNFSDLNRSSNGGSTMGGARPVADLAEGCNAMALAGHLI